MLRVVNEFHLNGRDYKRGDTIADADVEAVSDKPSLRKRCVAVADKAPAQSTPTVTTPLAAAAESKE